MNGLTMCTSNEILGTDLSSYSLPLGKLKCGRKFLFYMGTIMYSVRTLETDGTFNPYEELGGVHLLDKWSFVNITTIDGVQISIQEHGDNPPTAIILNQ